MKRLGGSPWSEDWRSFDQGVSPLSTTYPFLTFPAYEGDETGDKSPVPPGLRIDPTWVGSVGAAHSTKKTLAISSASPAGG